MDDALTGSLFPGITNGDRSSAVRDAARSPEHPGQLPLRRAARAPTAQLRDLRSSRLSGVTEGLAFRPKHVSCATNRRSQVLADQWPR